jgi:hypothetical protein
VAAYICCSTSLEEVLQSRPRFIVEGVVQVGDVCSRLDLLERLDSEQGSQPVAYAPVLFVSRSKITRADRLGTRQIDH